MDTIVRRLRESRKPNAEYYKKVEDVLNNQLFGDELYVRVENLEVVSETPTKITFKVDYQVTISIPMYDEESEREYEETEEEYRTRSLTLDKADLEESKICESEAKYWLGKYQSAVSKEWHKVVFLSSGTIEDAEETLDGLIKEPYMSMRVLGSAPSLDQCRRDGFTLLEAATPYNGYDIKWVNDPQGGKHVEVYDKDKKFKASYEDDEKAKSAIDSGEILKESTSTDEWTHWEMPENYKGPWQQDHYYKEYGKGIIGFIYPPYEATVSALKDQTHYDHVAVLYDNNAANTIDNKSVNSMDDAKAWLDHNAEYTISKMTESENTEKFSVGSTFKNAGFTWKVLAKKGDYTLVYAADKKWNPYVVAWKVQDDGSWAQGHYFSKAGEAKTFLDKKA